MDKHEKRMIDIVNHNHNLKVIEDQTNAFAARLNAIAARRRKKGGKK